MSRYSVNRSRPRQQEISTDLNKSHTEANKTYVIMRRGPPLLFMPSPNSSPSLPMEQRRKKVSFGDSDIDIVEIESTSEISLDEKRQIWYSNEDYILFRANARIIVREARKIGLVHMLDGTCTEIDDPQDRKLKAQQLLKRWCRHGQVGRGLERGIHPAMGKIRNLETNQYVQTVLSTQTLIRGCLDIHYRADELACVAIAFSARSREFALFMGRADAYAAEEGQRTLTQDVRSFRSESYVDSKLSDSPPVQTTFLERLPRLCTSRMA
jgi:hypothetical protein